MWGAQGTLCSQVSAVPSREGRRYLLSRRLGVDMLSSLEAETLLTGLPFSLHRACLYGRGHMYFTNSFDAVTPNFYLAYFVAQRALWMLCYAHGVELIITINAFIKFHLPKVTPWGQTPRVWTNISLVVLSSTAFLISMDVTLLATEAAGT